MFFLSTRFLQLEVSGDILRVLAFGVVHQFQSAVGKFSIADLLDGTHAKLLKGVRMICHTSIERVGMKQIHYHSVRNPVFKDSVFSKLQFTLSVVVDSDFVAQHG